MSRVVRMVIGWAMVSGMWPLAASAQDSVVVSCVYITHEGEPVRVCNTQNSMMQIVWDCRSSDCRICGVCHLDDAATRPFDSALHRRRAFPKLTLTPAAPVPWTSDVQIVLDGGRLCARARSGRRLHCYPPGSLLLRDRTGTPALIVSDRP